MVTYQDSVQKGINLGLLNFSDAEKSVKINMIPAIENFSIGSLASVYVAENHSVYQLIADSSQLRLLALDVKQPDNPRLLEGLTVLRRFDLSQALKAEFAAYQTIYFLVTVYNKANILRFSIAEHKFTEFYEFDIDVRQFEFAAGIVYLSN